MARLSNALHSIYTVFVIDLASRRVQIVGSTPFPHDLFMRHVARTLTTEDDGLLQEAVTVTGESPLVETTSSTVSSNIDPRQMQELPINGRNWMDLTLLRLEPAATREAG
jgi:hypothetical protein